MDAKGRLIRVAASLLMANPLPSDCREDYARKTISTKWLAEQMTLSRSWLRGQANEVKDAADALTAELAAAERKLDAALKLLSEQDYEYNRKTNDLIQRHAEQLDRLN